MRCKRLESLKETLNLVITALEEEDRISLISFTDEAKEVFPLSKMNNINKENAKNIVNNLIADGSTKFNPAIKMLVEKIKSSYPSGNINDGRVKSVIFLTDGEPSDSEYIKYMNNEIKNANMQLDFSISVFGIYEKNTRKNDLPVMSERRDGAFYSIRELNTLKDYTLNCVGGMRTTTYKFMNITINSKYTINKLFGEKYYSSCAISKDRFHIDSQILQFISGKEYIYVL